jgi:hypothetical protein
MCNALGLRWSSYSLLSIVQDKTPMPLQAPTPDEDDKLFEDDPWIESPINMDYGHNVKLGKNVFLNFNSVSECQLLFCFASSRSSCAERASGPRARKGNSRRHGLLDWR